jgi:hypothetical protein
MTVPCTTASDDFLRTVNSDGLPFFERFYAGGISSSGRVRGFVDNSLGPREFNGYSSQPIGGALKTVGTVELVFPKLFDSPAARISAFLDWGNVFEDINSFEASELRASAGVALLWRSPMGPAVDQLRLADPFEGRRSGDLLPATTSSACSSPSAVVLTRPGRRMSAPTYTAAELAARFGLDVAGDPARRPRRATLADATPDTLGFLANPALSRATADTQAGVVVMRAEDAEGSPAPR